MKSPLNEWHISSQAKLADFGGWDMPIEYPKGIQTNSKLLPGGTIAEHTAVRERVGIFDVSHLGKIRITGAGAKYFINTLITNDLDKIKPGQAQYNLMCDDNGGVIDDLIIYEISDSDLFLIPNASNCASVEARIVAKAPKNLDVVNLHQGYGVLAVQGPLAGEVLAKLGIQVELDYMSFAQIKNDKYGELIICRTGYTGEFGFELLPSWENTLTLWSDLVEIIAQLDGAVCGLGARDTLRTEMGYPLHGHELSLEISPVQASANWAVVYEKENFSGKSALEEQKKSGPKTAMRAIKILDRGIPRAGMKVLNETGAEIGTVTSGTFSPTLKVGIALALINPEYKSGSKVSVDVRGRISQGELVKLPFVESHVK